jgi:hypothetical protein
MAPEILLCDARKDLVRLYAEIDSLKRKRERSVKERTTEETWWLYICSFMPTKAAEYTRQKQWRDCIIVDLIGQQRTKESHIQLLLKEMRSFQDNIRSSTSTENAIKAEMRYIEQEWSNRVLLDFARKVAKQREQPDRAWQSTQARQNGYSNQPNMWDFW